MKYEEAIAWLRGERSMTNMIQSSADTNCPWIVQTAQADAAATQQAYWVVKAHNEGMIEPHTSDKSQAEHVRHEPSKAADNSGAAGTLIS